MANQPCRYYKCGVGSKPCLRLRDMRRLFCLECSLVGKAVKAPPAEPEINLNLGRCGFDELEETPSSNDMEGIMVEEYGAPPELNQPNGDETIGLAISKLRREKNISAVALARVAGVSVHSVYRWEKGESEPYYKAARALDGYFHTDLVERFGDSLRGSSKTCFDATTHKACSIDAEEAEVEQGSPQVAKKTKQADCSRSTAVPAVERQPDQSSGQKRSLEIITLTVEAMGLLAGGLGLYLKKIAEAGHEGGEL